MSASPECAHREAARKWEERNSMKPKTLKASLLFITICVVVLLSTTLAGIGILIYRSETIARYQNYAGDSIEFIAGYVDGDDLEQCINTGQKSKKYEELQRLANQFKETHDLMYLYIVKPLKIEPPDNMMDVMAAVTTYELAEEADQLTDLGRLTGDAYPAAAAKQYMARMDHDPKITFFQNDTVFGNRYTAVRPLFNSDGEPIAVLCADITIQEIHRAAFQYILTAVLSSLLFSAAAVLLLNHWIVRRVAYPIGKLQRSTEEFAQQCRNRAAPIEWFTMSCLHTWKRPMKRSSLLHGPFSLLLNDTSPDDGAMSDFRRILHIGCQGWFSQTQPRAADERSKSPAPGRTQHP